MEPPIQKRVLTLPDPKDKFKNISCSNFGKIVDLPSYDPEMTDEDMHHLLERLPPFDREKTTDKALHKILKHILPYSRRKLLDNVLYEIFTYLSDDCPPYDPNLLVCSLDPQASLSVPKQLIRAWPEKVWPEERLKWLINFSHVNYAVRLAHEWRMSPISTIHNDILKIILDMLSPILNGKLLPPDDRASLSVESFVTEPPPQFIQEYSHIDCFSRACKKFLGPGRKRLFVRVSVRFSTEGFNKLRQIASQPLLALSVKKFSYMMPRFYSQDHDDFEELLRAFNEPSQTTSIRQVERGRNRQPEEPRRTIDNHNQITKVMLRAEDQKTIIENRIDRDTLLYALSRFKNLQQVRLMRVQDPIDTGWVRFLTKYPRYNDDFKAEDWGRSCERAAATLSWVIMRSNNRQLSRFSSRFMETSSPLIITQSLRTTISSLAQRLVLLELEFIDERSPQHRRMLELSELFKTVFTAATNLQCLHVGFRHRVSASLSLLFQDVRFLKLVHIGLHMWHLDSDELIELLRKHQPTLRSIRLRNITLKQELHEKNWEKVLRYIRSAFPNLEWISLRRASYDSSTSALTHPMGGLHFVPPGHPHILQYVDSEDDSNVSSYSPDTSDNSDSSIEEGEEPPPPPPQWGNNIESASEEHDVEDSDSSVAEIQDNHDEMDSDIEEDNNNNLIFPSSFLNEDSLASYPPHTAPVSEMSCECGNGYGWDALDDDGVSVDDRKRKKWQKWVVKSCSIHDPKDTLI